MFIVIFSFDVRGEGGSEDTLRAVARTLTQKGHVVSWIDRPRSISRNPDVIISHQFGTQHAIKYAKMVNAPVVHFVHGPGQYHQVGIDLTVFNSKHQSDLVPNQTSKSFILYPPVYQSKCVIEERDPKAIVMIGSKYPIKGHDMFTALAGEFPNEKFIIFGELPKKESFVDFPPLVDGEYPKRLPVNLTVKTWTSEIKEIYKIAKVIVVPSINESYCRVAVEAGLNGIPVVASNHPGVREATRNAATYVDKFRSVQSFKDALSNTLRNVDYLGKKLRKALAGYDPVKDIEGLVTVLENLSSPRFDLSLQLQIETRPVIPWVMNLERRPDRLAAFQKQADQNGLINYQIFKAVDGKKLVLTPTLERLFKDHVHRENSASIGNTISHFRLWQKIAEGSDHCGIILEDDIDLTPNFQGKINQIQGFFEQDAGLDAVIFGYVHHKVPDDPEPTPDVFLTLRDFTTQYYWSGAFAYAISQRYAKFLVESFVKRGFFQTSDTQLLHHALIGFKIYLTSPRICISGDSQNVESVDTDIWKNKEKFLPAKFALDSELVMNDAIREWFDELYDPDSKYVLNPTLEDLERPISNFLDRKYPIP